MEELRELAQRRGVTPAQLALAWLLAQNMAVIPSSTKRENLAANLAALKVTLTAEEMAAIALRLRPHAVCLVPEKREERTTEGGLDVAGDENRLAQYVAPLRDAGCRVSMFIGHDPRQIEASARIGAAVVELHTGHYSDLHAEGRHDEAEAELAALCNGASLAHALGLEVHAGHGLTYENVAPIAAIPELRELNIGHFLIGEAVFMGLGPAIEEMRRRMDMARPRRG